MNEEYLLIDGYNVIYAWKSLYSQARANFNAARLKLQDIVCNYQGYCKCKVIIVYDAYKVKGNAGSVQSYHNISVVFTKEAETADQYIERTAGQLLPEQKVRVVTSDHVEQVIVMGKGALRVSAREFEKEVEEVNRMIRKEYLEKTEGKRNFLINNLSPEMAELLEKMRLNKDE